MDCCNHQCEACHKHKERTPEEMKALINRLNRIEGQVRGILFIFDGFWAGILRFFSLGCLRLFSGRGEIPHRRYPDLTRGARERPTLVWNLGRGQQIR